MQIIKIELTPQLGKLCLVNKRTDKQKKTTPMKMMVMSTKLMEMKLMSSNKILSKTFDASSFPPPSIKKNFFSFISTPMSPHELFGVGGGAGLFCSVWFGLVFNLPVMQRNRSHSSSSVCLCAYGKGIFRKKMVPSPTQTPLLLVLRSITIHIISFPPFT